MAVDPGDEENIRQQWQTFLSSGPGLLDHPGVRASLLQAGISLLQPPSFGDTPMSQIGRAIGSGAEVVGRQEEMNRKELEAESKAQLREMQANLAGATAATRGAQATAATEKLQTTRNLADLQSRIKLQGMYGTYERGVRERNAAALANWNKEKLLQPNLPEPAQEPVLTPEQWAAKNPMVRDLGLGGAIPGVGRGGQQPVHVNSPEEARQLPSGTPIILPDGTTGTVP